MPIDVGYLSAFIIGLLGGVHCIGMCGGIVTALSFSARSTGTTSTPFPPSPTRPHLSLLLGYNLGRLTSYTIAGALFGGIGALAVSSSGLRSAQTLLLVIAALFMLALGLYLGGWWRGLARLEQAGSHLWRRIEPLGRGLLPVRSPWQAVALGALWGWLPCGLVYSVLVWSIASGDALRGALLLLCFGLGTLPNLLAMGLLSGWVASASRKTWIRQLAGGLIIAFALWTLLQLGGAIG